VEFNEEMDKDDRLYLLRQKLHYHFNRNTLFIYGKSIVVLFDKDTVKELFDPEKLQQFAELLRSVNCKAAFSLYFEHLHEFCEHYTQASCCNVIARRLGVGGEVTL
jgi:hypothetical protein